MEGIIMQKFIKAFFLVVTFITMGSSIQGMGMMMPFGPRKPSPANINRETIQREIAFMKAIMAGDIAAMRPIIDPLQKASGLVENKKLTEQRLQETEEDPANMLSRMLRDDPMHPDIDAPIDPDHPEGSRLLDIAVKVSSPDCIEVLIEHGADPALVTEEHQKIIRAIHNPTKKTLNDLLNCSLPLGSFLFF